jgi:DNA-binding NarL/FixJ family response regulator
VIRVLVADDHAVVRQGLRRILSETSDILVGGEAATAHDVRRLIREEAWDVMVLDINLGGVSGIELIGEIHQQRPRLPVVVLTMYSEEQYAVRAIKAGAAGFLTKESAPDKLIEAVRKVASGGRYVGAELAEVLASAIAGDKADEPHEGLSNRELEILKMIGSGKTVSEIARVLTLSVKTVSTHRTRILRKMNMHTNAELMRYAVRSHLVD